MLWHSRDNIIVNMEAGVTTNGNEMKVGSLGANCRSYVKRHVDRTQAALIKTVQKNPE
jgi:hypothetical protein